MELNKLYVGLGGGSLLQISARTLTQMMSYVITTPGGKCIVIDGGNKCPEDAAALYAEIEKHGKRVEYWYITHAHSDHIGALTYLLETTENFDIEIGSMCFNFPGEEWLRAGNFGVDAEMTFDFLRLLGEKNIPVKTVVTGDIIECDGTRVEIIHHPEEYSAYKNINSTSIIFKLSFPSRDVLFTGDFEAPAQPEFMKLRDPSKLRCDILQMPHHGQNGVNREFYELVSPKICLYTAPIWLWENNRYRCLNPETRGKGPFTIFETRAWMEELGAQVSCVDGFGDYLLF